MLLFFGLLFFELFSLYSELKELRVSSFKSRLDFKRVWFDTLDVLAGLFWDELVLCLWTGCFEKTIPFLL